MKIDIGFAITIRGTKFNLMYDGMEQYCYLCRGKHGKECPTITRWNELKRIRDEKPRQGKIFSDSSMRSTNQLALTTDVVCMSGAGLGQLVNVIKLDEKHENTIIHGGNNEIVRTSSLTEFVYTVETAVNKIKHIASDRNITVVLPCAPTVGPVEEGKAKYLEEKITEISTIKTLKLKNIDYDESSHPSEEGTKEMIRQINESGNNIIMEEAKEEITTIKKYSQVYPVFKVGCRGCDNLEFTSHLCSTCLDRCEQVDTAYLSKIIEEIQNTSYPEMGSPGEAPVDDDVKMKEVMKRENSNMIMEIMEMRIHKQRKFLYEL